MKPSQTLQAKKIKLDRERKNLKVFDGGLGENPFPTPTPIVNALIDHAKESGYHPADGILELQHHFPNQRLVVGNGLKPLLMVVQLAFSRMHPNAVIVHIIPAWVSYMEQTELLNLRTVQVKTKPSAMWRLTPDDLRETFDKYQLKSTPHMIILNNPNNPTGHVYNVSEMEKFGEVFNEYGTTVIYDVIYEHIVFPSVQRPGDIRISCKKVVSASSLSKNYAAGGYRLGWLAFPEILMPLWGACFSVSTYMYTCPTTPVQYAAAKALDSNDKLIQHSLKFQSRTFYHISKVVLHKLRAMKLKCTQTEGAYYTLVDFEYYIDALKKYGITTSDQLCIYMAEHLGLITVSGSAFGIDKPCVVRYSMVDIIDIDPQRESFDFLPIGQFLQVLGGWLKQL